MVCACKAQHQHLATCIVADGDMYAYDTPINLLQRLLLVQRRKLEVLHVLFEEVPQGSGELRPAKEVLQLLQQLNRVRIRVGHVSAAARMLCDQVVQPCEATAPHTSDTASCAACVNTAALSKLPGPCCAPECAPAMGRLVDLAKQLAWTLPVGLAFTDLVASIVKVEGPSMQPTFNPNLGSKPDDWVLVEKVSYKLRHIYNRGDVAVLW